MSERDAPAPEPSNGRMLPEPGQPAPTLLATVAVGVDFVERARVNAVFQRHGERFLRRVFTPREVAEASGRIERLAGRFAAKEACAKALGTGIGSISWQEIEIERRPGGKPALRLTGQAAALAATLGLTAFDVSIADTGDHVLAVVVGIRG
jgi:holo-[acyl-carrier protein] synthase